MINYQMKILSGVVDNLSQDSKFRSIVAELDNNQDRGDIEELKALVEGLKKLRHSYFHCKRGEQSYLAINLVLTSASLSWRGSSARM